MSIKRLQKLKNKTRRDLFVGGQIKTGIPFQIRAMRDKKDWTQAQLGAELGMTQTNISRLESPGYGRLNITTLQRIASVFDVALVVRFVPFSELIRWTDNLSPEAMAPVSFEEEIDTLEQEAAASITTYTTVPVSAFAVPGNFQFEGVPVQWATSPGITGTVANAPWYTRVATVEELEREGLITWVRLPKGTTEATEATEPTEATDPTPLTALSTPMRRNNVIDFPKAA